MADRKLYGWRDFHYLIEISFNLREATKAYRGNIKSSIKRKEKEKWEEKMDFWLEVNYHDNGIDDRIVSEVFNKSKLS